MLFEQLQNVVQSRGHRPEYLATVACHLLSQIAHLLPGNCELFVRCVGLSDAVEFRVQLIEFRKLVLRLAENGLEEFAHRPDFLLARGFDACSR
jgi:hypothetical protein